MEEQGRGSLNHLFDRQEWWAKLVGIMSLEAETERVVVGVGVVAAMEWKQQSRCAHLLVVNEI